MNTRISPKEIPVLLGSLGLLCGAGVLGWLGWGKLEDKKTEAQALAARAGNPDLANLLANEGAIHQATHEMAELKRLTSELQEKYGQRMKKWSEGTLAISGNGEEWSKEPGQWKDRLIKVQSDLQAEAMAKGVQLPPDFYLGLESFRQKSPMADEVPNLAIHLSVVRSLLNKLFRARETKEKFPTACEVRSVTGAASKAEKNNEPNSMVLETPLDSGKSQLDRKTFRMDFRCSPEVFFAFLDLLKEDPQDPALYIVTNITLANEKQNFPLRSEIAKRFRAEEGAPSSDLTPKAKGPEDTSPREAKLLEILAGNEVLDLQMRLDFVAWSDPRPDPTESSKEKKP